MCLNFVHRISQLLKTKNYVCFTVIKKYCAISSVANICFLAILITTNRQLSRAFLSIFLFLVPELIYFGTYVRAINFKVKDLSKVHNFCPNLSL